MRQEEPHTSVVVPSLTLDQAELRKLPGVSFYEERLLFLLIRLRNPRGRMVYITSQPIHPMILEYYFQFLAGVPGQPCARAPDAPLRARRLAALADREDPGAAAPDRAHPRRHPRRATAPTSPSSTRPRSSASWPCCSASRSTAWIPKLTHLGTKSGSRKVFREAGDRPARGRGGPAHGARGGERAAWTCARSAPRSARAVVKLNDSFSGEGNALFRYPDGVRRSDVPGCLARHRVLGAHRDADPLLREVRAHGRRRRGVHRSAREALAERAGAREPRRRGDADLHARPDPGRADRPGVPRLQLPRPRGIPAGRSRRRRARSARVLASYGVVSRFGIDFLVWRQGPHEPWQVTALEINLRMGGTTHPYLALQFLTGGQLDPATGLFILHHRAREVLPRHRQPEVRVATGACCPRT